MFVQLELKMSKVFHEELRFFYIWLHATNIDKWGIPEKSHQNAAQLF